MKTGKILLSLALTFGSMAVLASCGGGKTPASSSEKIEVTGALSVVIGSPEGNVIVGDEIDLDDYVTVEGIRQTKMYTAELSTATTAKLEGHKLTILAEGTVTVKISATNGDETKSGRFTCTAMSAEAAKFDQMTANMGRNYLLADIDLSTGYLTGTGTLHNENYFSIYVDSDEDGKDLAAKDCYYMGLLKAKSGNTYWYTMSDLDGKNLEVEPGVQSQFELYYIANPLPLAASNFKTVTEVYQGSPYTYLQCTDAATIASFCQCSIGYNSPAKLGYKNAAIDVEFDTLTDGTEVMVVSLHADHPTSGQTYYWGMWILSGDAADYTVKGLEDYIASGVEPEPIKYTEFTSKVAEINDAKNYTVDYKSYWSSTYDRGGSDISNDQYDEDGTYGDYIPAFTAKSEVTSDSVYSTYTTKDNDDKDVTNVEGVVVHEGSVYEFGTNATGSIETVKGDASETVWTDKYNVYTFSGAASADLSKIICSSREEAAGIVTLAFGAETCSNFMLGVVNMVPGYGPTFGKYFGQALQDGGVLGDYFNIYAYVGADSTVIDFALGWDQGAIYHLELTFSKIGTTVANPALADLTFAA